MDSPVTTKSKQSLSADKFHKFTLKSLKCLPTFKDGMPRMCNLCPPPSLSTPKTGPTERRCGILACDNVRKREMLLSTKI